MRLIPRVFALLLLAVPACSPSALQVQRSLATQVARASDALTDSLAAAYRAEGLALIAAATTRQDAAADLVLLRARWRPVFGRYADGALCTGARFVNQETCRDGALPALKAAEDAWADALSRGEPTMADALNTIERMRGAYCQVRAAAPAGVRLPDPPAFLTCDPPRTP